MSIQNMKGPKKTILQSTAADTILRIGHVNILRSDVEVSYSEFLSIASDQGKLEFSPQENLIQLYQKVQVFLKSVKFHIGNVKNKNLYDETNYETNLKKFEDFSKKIEEYAKQKGVSLKNDHTIAKNANYVQPKPSEKKPNLNFSDRRNSINLGDEPQFYLSKDLSNEEVQSILKKLNIILKKIAVLEKKIGNKEVFQTESITRQVDEEISGLEQIEIDRIVENINRLDFIFNDFNRNQMESKKQFLQQEQKKEILTFIADFLSEFPDEEIDAIPEQVSSSVDVIVKHTTFLNDLSKLVENLTAAKEILSETKRQGSDNHEVLVELKGKVEENFKILQTNKLFK